MKYSNKRNYPYPVLRPYSLDYGDSSEFSTQLSNPIVYKDTNELSLSLSYDVKVSSLNALVYDGKASCAAMLYCPSTLHRTFRQAEAGIFDLSYRVPLDLLSGSIEIHPSIIANADFVHGFDGKVDDYGDREWQVQRGKPLAVDQTWHFTLEPNKLEPTESVFNLIRNESVPADQVEVRAYPGQRHIDILAHPTTLARLQVLRDRGVDAAIVSIYIGPLMEALMVLQSEERDDYSYDNETGWVASLRAKLSFLGLWPLTDEQSLYTVAQQLFEYPYGRLTVPSQVNEEVL